jgi:hypothetical protein
LNKHDPRKKGICKIELIDCENVPDNAACIGICIDNKEKTVTECACKVGDERDDCNSSKSIHVALSLFVTVILIPAFALFL